MLLPITQWVLNYKYAVIYILLMFGIIGLPVPDETLLSIVGFLIYRGDLWIYPALISAIMGSISGITCSYFLGKIGILFIIKKHTRYFNITPEKLSRVESWFKHKGKWSLVIGYYLPGIRHFVAMIAGASNLPYSVFSAYAYTGAVLWVSIFITLGYTLGEAWCRFSQEIHKIAVMVLFIIVVVFIVYYVTKRYFQLRY